MVLLLKEKILLDYKEMYKKVVQLVCKEYKNDPPTEPFRSHYAAKNLLLQLKEKLNYSLASVKAEGVNFGSDYFIYQMFQALVCCKLAKIYVIIGEVPKGELLFQECLELVTPHKLTPLAITSYIGALMELGVIYANRTEYKKSFDMIQKAEKAYTDFIATEQIALAITDIFGTADEVEKGKDQTELECIFMELTSNFALNLVKLSDKFIDQNMFKQARYHLAVATLIMSEKDDVMLKSEHPTDAQKADIKEEFKQSYALVAGCWAKYGLKLLSASKDRLCNHDEEKLTEDARRLKLSSNSNVFPNLQLKAYEDRITCDYCLTFEDAKEVYHFDIKWLDIAKKHYKLDTNATVYAMIIMAYAELYELIAFFEKDPVNQSKMQKRRTKYYEEILELLNPVLYMAICRDCWYGAGEAYSAIIDIKVDGFKAKGRSPNPQELGKINQICQQAIKYFKSFIESYKENDGTWKSNMDIDAQKTVLYALIKLGDLYSNIITPDDKLQLESLCNSIKYYKAFVEECGKQEEAAKAWKAELGEIRERINMTTTKIAILKMRIK